MPRDWTPDNRNPADVSRRVCNPDRELMPDDRPMVPVMPLYKGIRLCQRQKEPPIDRRLSAMRVPIDRSRSSENPR
mgnify:CR=1 FL=1